MLSGSAGVLRFSASPALASIGIHLQRISVSFVNRDGGKVGYSATFNLEVISITVMDEFDLEALITACSGLLCQAARVMKGRHKAYERELERIMMGR